MSETLISAGQVFGGGSVAGGGQAGTIALTEVGSVAFDTALTPPTVSSVTITQDSIASAVAYPLPIIGDVFIQSVTIDAVHPDTALTLTTADLPPGVTVPAGFTLPQTVTGTELDVTVQTNQGAITGTGQVGLYGITGNLALVGVENLSIDGIPVNVGAAVLAVGTQATGAVDETFTPLFTATCFGPGTHIRTIVGDVPVEALREGDIVTLADGTDAGVVWIGHRRVDCALHPKPLDVMPVRICAGAFGAGLPQRDLVLSPDHAVFVDGVLIPVRYLLNGATIRQEAVEAVTDRHVELAHHAVLLAEGLPVESYLDTGNRHAFANGGGVVMAHPEFARDAALDVWARESCAELTLGGPIVQSVRQRLLDQALALGWRLIDDPALRLLVDDHECHVSRSEDGPIRMTLPNSARTIRLESRRFIPATLDADAGDWRQLGVAVAVTLGGAEIPLPCYVAGWHAAEEGAAWRWTDGAATLALPVLTGPNLLEIRLIAAGARYWIAPEAAELGHQAA